MKTKLLTLLLMITSCYNYAQVVIGETNTLINNKAILSFTTRNSGIILPIVDNNTSITHTPGTLLYNLAERQVQMLTDTGWLSLTGGAVTPEVDILAGNPNYSSYTENATDQGMIIGAESSTSKGLLILESDDKTLILPRVDLPYEKIYNPHPGTMVYGEKDGKTYLYIFNGKEWSIWTTKS